MAISLEARSPASSLPPLGARIKDGIVRGLLSFTGTQKFLTAQLDITNACNLRCAHCYHAHHSNAGALDLDGWRRVLDQYEALARKLYLAPRFVLCGGEPTTSPLFHPILRELDSRWPGVRIAVLTNGTRLTESFVSKLEPFNVGFQISLDGPDTGRHDAIRGAGSFEQAIDGFRVLRRHGREAGFLATLSARSAPWIGAFFALAKAIGAQRMSFTRFISEGTGRRLEGRGADRPLRPSELRDAYRAILDASRATGVATNTDLPLYHLVEPGLGAHGKVGFQGLVIDYKGNLKVTSRTSAVLGNVLAEGLEALFLKHPVMEALRDRRIEGCGTCAHYDRCGGDRNAAFSAAGDFLAKDPGCWLEES